jgi:RNA polymerase sigma-70 factor (ECF subfamily)
VTDQDVDRLSPSPVTEDPNNGEATAVSNPAHRCEQRPALVWKRKTVRLYHKEEPIEVRSDPENADFVRNSVSLRCQQNRMELMAGVEPRTLESLWRQFGPRLILYAAAIVKDRSLAEDILQSLFVRLLSSGTLPPAEGEATYLFRAVRNEALNELRSRTRARRAYSALLEPDTEDPGKAAQMGELGKRIEEVLLEIPQDEREAVVLKIWGDVSFAHGALISGVTEKTFEYRYYKALAIIKEKMGRAND